MVRPPLLDVIELSKHFDGLQVITELSFAVAAGECVGLIGPNGAGKTTAFNLIGGVYPVDRGSILFDGTDITALPSWRRAGRGIGRTFQNIRLMPHLTALENVMFGQHCRAKGWGGMLQPLRLTPRNRWRDEAHAMLAQLALETYAPLPVGGLPYGIQKRIELARAMMARPRLLLLDEPAAGLNPVESDWLCGQLRAIAESGVALLVVEHDMGFVGALCERLVVLSFGQKIAEGTPAAIRDMPAMREAYLGWDDATQEAVCHAS